MLNIGQSVYTVCKLYKTKDKFIIYTSKKDIVGINLDNNGTVVYTAGKYRELHFIEVGDGTYQSVKGKRTKSVYLTKQEADVERKTRWENEKNIISAKNGGNDDVEQKNNKE